jgi:hypothetical protein
MKTSPALARVSHQKWIPAPVSMVRHRLSNLPHQVTSTCCVSEEDEDGTVTEVFVDGACEGATMRCVFRPVERAGRLGTQLDVTVQMPLRRLLSWWGPMLQALKRSDWVSGLKSSNPTPWPKMPHLISL